VHVIGERVLIEAARCLDRLREDLASRIAERHEAIAEWIELFARRHRARYRLSTSATPGKSNVGAGTKLSMLTSPSRLGASSALIGVISNPIMVPPNIFGISPISCAARTMPTVSGG